MNLEKEFVIQMCSMVMLNSVIFIKTKDVLHAKAVHVVDNLVVVLQELEETAPELQPSLKVRHCMSVIPESSALDLNQDRLVLGLVIEDSL